TDAGAHALPQLVALAAPDDSGRDKLEELLALRISSELGGAGDDALRAQLERMLATLARFLRAAAFVLDYPLVVARGGATERWVGLRRPRRRLAVVADRALADGDVALLDATGNRVIALDPLVRVAAPSAGAD